MDNRKFTDILLRIKNGQTAKSHIYHYLLQQHNFTALKQDVYKNCDYSKSALEAARNFLTKYGIIQYHNQVLTLVSFIH